MRKALSVMRAPTWKLIICIGLERFYQHPIIQAPKRNSKLHSEMRMDAFFAEGPLGARARVRDASRSVDERHARFL